MMMNYDDDTRCNESSLWTRHGLTQTEWCEHALGRAGFLDKVSDVHGHLFNLRVVERLNVLQRATIVDRHEVDSDALTTEPTPATNPGNDIPILLLLTVIVTKFMVPSSWHCYSGSSRNSCDQCSMNIGQPMTLGWDQSAWALDLPKPTAVAATLLLLLLLLLVPWQLIANTLTTEPSTF